MKRILVAVDDSAGAPVIIAQAVELARALDGKIRLLHTVMLPAPPPTPGVVAPSAGYVEEVVGGSEAMLQRLLDSVPEDLRDGWSLEMGPPAHAVCRLARVCDADLVVIGAHEHGVVARALGTTAARIVDNIDRPVFVVRPLPPAPSVAA